MERLVFYVAPPPKEEVLFSLQGIVEEESSFLQMPVLAEELIVFHVPPCPTHGESQILIKLRRSQEIVSVPFSEFLEKGCRINLRYDAAGVLRLGEVGSRMWAECVFRSEAGVAMKGYLSPNIQTIIGSEWVDCLYGEIEKEPIPAGSVFLELAEAHWLGLDLVQKRYGTSSRCHWIEIRSEKKRLEEGELLTLGVHGDAIARIIAVNQGLLEWEGWEKDLYVRFSMRLTGEVAWRGKELWSQVRIRSRQQMRGFFEKQPLVLHVGDWVLKQQGMWRVLHKKGEREAFLRGDLWGELFVLERIDRRNRQYVAQGTLFHASRTVEMAIEGQK